VIVDGWWVTPATVKAVVRRGDEVLLGRNDRGEWELPGGRPDQHEPSVAEVLERELLEETGLQVRAGRLLLADLFEVVPGHRLLVVVLLVDLLDGAAKDDAVVLRPSSEHSELAWFHHEGLPHPLPSLYRRAIVEAFA
jgi:8-oxo-dGTP diphosphatase